MISCASISSAPERQPKHTNGDGKTLPCLLGLAELHFLARPPSLISEARNSDSLQVKSLV